MNPSGKSAGGGGKGKASKSKAGGGDVITSSYALQTQRSHLLLLRKALQTDEGRDKDVTAPFAAFMKFSRNGLDAELKFATGAKLDKAQLRGAKKLVESLAEDALSDCGLTLEDKARAAKSKARRCGIHVLFAHCVSELPARLTHARAVLRSHQVADFKDAAARFLFAYGPAKSEDEDKPVIAVCHFRLTLAGELQNEMEGDPVLLVADMFVAPEAQRKGLGSHMLNLCQLVARGNGLTGVMVGMYTALARSAEPWLLKKQRGFELDVTWTPDADSGIAAYFKPAVVAKAAASPASSAAAAICAPAASSPDSVLSASASAASPSSPAAAPEARAEAPGVALASQFEKVSVQEEVPFWQRVAAPAAPAETVESASESEDDDDDEESEEDDDEQAERILDELAAMFEERHGRPPTAEEVEQWKATLNEASAEQAAANDSA